MIDDKINAILKAAGGSPLKTFMPLTQDRLREAMTAILATPDFLVIGAFRYALGRQTYVVNETVEWMIANWATVSDKAKAVIRRDLKEATDEDLRLGGEIDKREWLRLWEVIK